MGWSIGDHLSISPIGVARRKGSTNQMGKRTEKTRSRAAPGRVKIKRTELAAYVKSIREAVQAELPEDELDEVATWVYETAVKVVLQQFQNHLVEVFNERLLAAKDRWKAEASLRKAETLLEQVDAARVTLRTTVRSAREDIVEADHAFSRHLGQVRLGFSEMYEAVRQAEFVTRAATD